MLGRTPEEIAKFLAKTTGLNKTMVGDYLGGREDMCIKVMHAYVDAMDFSGQSLDESIRSASPQHTAVPACICSHKHACKLLRCLPPVTAH